MNKKRNRRDFLKGAAAASLVSATALQAGEEPAPPREPAEVTAEALTSIVRARFGKHVTDAQIKGVQQRITGLVAAARTIKRTRLENGDEPDFVFFADGP